MIPPTVTATLARRRRARVRATLAARLARVELVPGDETEPGEAE